MWYQGKRRKNLRLIISRDQIEDSDEKRTEFNKERELSSIIGAMQMLKLLVIKERTRTLLNLENCPVMLINELLFFFYNDLMLK